MLNIAHLLVILGSATAFVPAGRSMLSVKRSVRVNVWPFDKNPKEEPQPAVRAMEVSEETMNKPPPVNGNGKAMRMPGALSVDLSKDLELNTIFAGNANWIADCTDGDPEFFSRFSQGQTPQILWIGCSDSRVPANRLMGLDMGDVFVTRNVANVVSHMDTSLMSVLQYAVEALKVPHIVVCGHYECGGVKASSTQTDHTPPLSVWLRNIRDVQRIYADELFAIKDDTLRVRRLVELNVIEQCLNLYKTGIIQRTRVKGGGPSGLAQGIPVIHPLVFDPTTGQLIKLDADLEIAVKALGNIYDMYELEHA